MPLNNQTERSEAEHAETFDRVTNLPPQTQKCRERPSTPQHYRDNPDLLRSVFDWSPERTSTPVQEDERSSSEGRQQSDDPTVPTRSLRRITKKIPERNNARQRETGTDWYNAIRQYRNQIRPIIPVPTRSRRARPPPLSRCMTVQIHSFKQRQTDSRVTLLLIPM
jgi:hypothetical protein